MNNRGIFFISLIFLTIILACVVPGLPTASAPTPTTDTGIILSTMVAETVSAAIALTEQAFPTPTLVPTSTTTSTSTPTLTPTPETASSGSTLSLQEDGSTFFVDERAGYEAIVPAGWLAMRVNQQEYRDALVNLPNISISLSSMQSNDPDIIRLFVIDTQAGHFQSNFFTNINFIWDEQAAVLLENDDEGLKTKAAQLVASIPGLEIISTEFSTTSGGVLVGLIESKSTTKNSSGADIVVFQMRANFNARAGTMVVTLSTVEGLKEISFSSFGAMLETIKVAVE